MKLVERWKISSGWRTVNGLVEIDGTGLWRSAAKIGILGRGILSGDVLEAALMSHVLYQISYKYKVLYYESLMKKKANKAWSKERCQIVTAFKGSFSNWGCSYYYEKSWDNRKL